MRFGEACGGTMQWVELRKSHRDSTNMFACGAFKACNAFEAFTVY